MHIYDVGLVGFVMLLPIIPLMTGINFLPYTTQNMCGLTQKKYPMPGIGQVTVVLVRQNPIIDF